MCSYIYAPFLNQISAWVFLINMFLYAGFYCSDISFMAWGGHLMQILGNSGQPRSPGKQESGTENLETGNRKPETETGNGYRNPQIKEDKFFKDENIALDSFCL